MLSLVYASDESTPYFGAILGEYSLASARMVSNEIFFMHQIPQELDITRRTKTWRLIAYNKRLIAIAVVIYNPVAGKSFYAGCVHRLTLLTKKSWSATNSR